MQEDFYPNGINGVTGEPLLRIDAETIANYLKRGQGAVSPQEQALHREKQRAAEGSLGTVFDTAPNQLDEARWSIVVNAVDDAQIIKALWPLIIHRCDQMGFTAPNVTFQAGENCAAWWSRHTDGGNKSLATHWGEIPPVLIYRPGEAVNTWLARHQVMAAPVDPARGVPYYLVLAGRPGAPDNPDAVIPLTFQYELDVFWAVGRLCFTDRHGQHRFDDYATYAERVVEFEQRADAATRLRKQITFFGTSHAGDISTTRSADELVAPLVEWAKTSNLTRKRQVVPEVYLAEAATRVNLEQVLRADQPPAIFFAAVHGVGLPVSDPRLVLQQGALLTADCGDYYSTGGFRHITRDHWLAAEDIDAQMHVAGMIALFFACYGAGCPQYDDFVFDENQQRRPIAPFTFIAQLPQRLLTNGTLAVLGHVDRAWTYSFSGVAGAKAQVQPFQDILGRLVAGERIGHALDPFNAIQGARSLTLTEELENIRFGKNVLPTELAQLWTVRNDARNYMLLGDPAVKSAVA